METCIGYVTHYYNHLGVAVLSLTQALKEDDIVHIFGHTTDLYQKAWSLEIDHHKIHSAGPGIEVALKVAELVHECDKIFVVNEITPEEQKDILRDQMLEKETP